MSNITTKEGIVVKVGQVWRDLDLRSRGRQLTVVSVDEENGKAVLSSHPDMKLWRTKISIRRMHRHSTGWELVRDVQ